MNKNRYFVVIMCALMMVPSVIMGEERVGYWEWFKQGASSLQQSIYSRMVTMWYLLSSVKAYFSHHKARLIAHNQIDLDGKKIEALVYDTSRDSDETKKMRKKLNISGLYFDDGSDMELYTNYNTKFPIDQQYIENGFDINKDNSISGCILRLFKGAFDNKNITVSDMVTGTNLLDELCGVLSTEFSIDKSGHTFIAFAKKIQSMDNSNNKPSLEKILLFLRLSDRFLHNKGLESAINNIDNIDNIKKERMAFEEAAAAAGWD